MKNILKIVVMVIALAVAAPAVNAQSTQKELKKALRQKVDKQSKKDAKALKKQGWKVMPGKLPLEKQIQQARYSELEKDGEGEFVYIIGTDKSVGGNYAAAKQISDNRAKLEIAAAINTIVTSRLKENSATTDFGSGDLETISEVIAATTSSVSAGLQGAETVLEIYRELPNGTTEIMTTCRIPRQRALETARSVYKKELLNRSRDLSEQLDELF